MKKVYDLLKKYYIFTVVILLMGMVSTMNAQPVVNAGADATICQNSTHSLSDATASGTGTLSYAWSGGAGDFDNPNSLNPVYTPGSADFGNTITLTLEVTDDVGTITDDMLLTVVDFPVVYAGADAEICEGGSYTINDATITGSYEAFLWAGGDGEFSNVSTLVTTYTPGPLDEVNGEVELSLIVAPQDPCIALQSDKLKLIILEGLIADAGPDATICEGETYTLLGSGSPGASYMWSGGLGSFDDATSLTATYTPDPTEYGTTVTLQLEVDNASCPAETDEMELTINSLPDVTCPDDFAVCVDDNPVTLSGATPAGGTYSGDGVSGGSFDPDVAGAGTHTITYNYMDPATGCEDECTFDITVNALPTVLCPGDINICEDADPFTLTGGTPTGGNYSGTGVSGGNFDPGVGAGTYTITYTYTDPVSGCENFCEFDIVVAPLPTVDAGDPQTVCEDQTVSLDATVLNECAITWTVLDGSGFFSNPNIEDPVYTLGQTEIENGSVTLRILAGACDPPCTAGQIDEVTITIERAPVADAGEDVVICEDESYTLQGSVTNTCGHAWSKPVDADGSFDDPALLDATYTPGPNDIAAGFVQLTLTAQPCGSCSTPDTDNIVLTIIKKPSVDIAVDNAEICEDGSYDLDATTLNTSSLEWTTTGNGTFSNPNAEDPTYTPGDADAPSVTLTLTGIPNSPCDTEDTDSMTLNIQVLPTVEAGSDADICENGSYTFNDASASDHNGLTWSGGTGSFDNGDQVDATYNAGAGETGDVVLTLTAAPIDPCNTSVDDFMTLTINPLPELTDITLQSALAGGPSYTPLSGDLTTGFGLCLDGKEATHYWLDVDALTATQGLEADFMNPFFHTATVPGDFFTYWADRGVDEFASGGWEEIMWDIINGNAPIFYLVYDGSDYALIDGLQYQFATLETPLTIPGNYPKGDYDFTGTIKDVNGCVSENITVEFTFGHEVFVDAGEDQTVCEGDDVQLDATVENDCAIQWVPVTASGTFSNETLANPVYIPGDLDYVFGYAELSIQVAACDPCTELAEDFITIYFDDPPTADAGENATICDDDSYELYGSVSNACSHEWSTTTGGTFDDASSLTATYTPSQTDINTGFVELTLTATGCGPCDDVEDTDTMIIEFQDSPTVDILVDTITACELDVIHFDNTLVTYGEKNTVIWFTGNGSNNWDDNTIDYPKYTLSQLDAAQEYINITVTVTGIDPCTTFDDDNCIIAVQLLPLVDAGENKTVCENGSVDLDDATALQYESLLWTSTYPDDSFSDATALKPSYSPGANAIATGETFLTLTAQPLDPCTATKSSSITVSIQDLPEPDAGADATICADESHSLSGTIDEACGTPSAVWSTSGTGTFGNVNLLSTTYTPSDLDKDNGSVFLILTGNPCTPCVDQVSDSLLLTIQPLPWVDAGEDADVCESGFFLLEATASDYSSISWTTYGTGTFDDYELLNPNYYPSEADANAGTVTLRITAYAKDPCTQESWDEITLNVQPLPIAEAGDDDTACETGYTFEAGSVAVYNNSNLEWTTNGDGEFDIATELLTTYIPGDGDVNAGIVTLTLVANPIHPCVISDQDDMDLVIFEEPEASAGDNDTICQNGTYQLNGGSASNYTSISWTANALGTNGGDGNFNDATILNPIYTPGAGDILDGEVQLCIEAEPKSPCEISATDCMTLTIQALPVADAGADGSLCETGGPISGTATNGTTTLWTTTTGGTFDDATELNTNYYPSVADITAGTVTLTLTVQPTEPCLADDSDDVEFTIQPEATADAGPDKTLCENQSIALNGASASNNGDILWTSSGDGTFNDPEVLNAVYHPGDDDKVNGVTLTITVDDLSPCSGTATDDMTIEFQPLPIANAGPDATLCEDAIFPVDASMQNAISILWTTNGDGTFSNPADTVPQYFPGTQDLIEGQVTLTISGTPIGPCNLSDGDDIVVTIIENASVNAGPDDEICEDQLTYTLSGATADNYSSLLWGSTGDGTFDDDSAENPVYTVGPNDPGTTIKLYADVEPISPCDTPASDTMELYIQKLPTVFAGADKSTCGVSPFILSDAWAMDYSAILWGTSGDGTFSDPTIETPQYFPGSTDSLNQGVVLTLAANAQSPCNPAVVVNDNVQITIQWEPIANAGPDDVVCETDSYQLNGSLTNSTSGFWTTDLGDGTFDDNTLTNATYTPGSDDITAGSVELCFTAEPISPCDVNSDPDCMTLTIQASPTADAGPDGVVCETGTYTVGVGDANVYEASGQVWTTDGDGTLTNETTLTPTYQAVSSDTVAGVVKLCLVAEPLTPCTVNSPEDCMELTIQRNPIADAGPDAAEACALSEFQIVGASAQYESSILWESSGDGTFNDAGLENPIYTLGPSDVGNTSITLTMTANAESPCIGIAQDVMTLNINPEPAVLFAANGDQFYGGASLEYCFDETITVTLDEIVTGDPDFDFEWEVSDGVNPPVSGSATGINLTNDVLFSNTYAPGSYTVSLTSMIDGNGCSPTDLSVYTVDFIVHPQPNPFFTIDGNVLAVGGDYEYCHDVSSIILAIVDEEGGNPAIGTEPFDIDFEISGGDLPAPVPVSLNDVNFDDDIDLLTYFTATPGYTYNIQVTYFADENGCEIPTTVLNNYYNFSITIQPEPAVLFAFNGDDASTGDVFDYCYNETIIATLSTIIEGTAPFEITIEENGTPTTYPNVNEGFEFFNGTKPAGTYNIVATSIVDADGCEVTSPGSIYNLTVEVHPEPAVLFSFNGNIAVTGSEFEYCETTTVEVLLNAALEGDAPFDISWTVDDGNGPVAGSATDVSVGGSLFSETLDPGTYDVVITGITDDNGCSVTDPENIYYATVNIQAAPTADAGDPTGDVCANGDITLNGSATNESSVLWTSSTDGTFDNPTSLTAVYTPGPTAIANGDVVLTLTANAINPCTEPAQDQITLTIQPESAVLFAAEGIPFFEGAVLEYCEGEDITITLHEILSGQGPFDIAWTLNGDADSKDNVNVGDELFSGPLPAGSYEIQITSIVDAFGCEPLSYDPYTATVEVSPPPAVIFAATDYGQFYEGAQLEYCEGDNIEVTLDQVLLGDAPFSVTWTENGINPQTVNDLEVDDVLFTGVKPVGSYEVQITNITDDNGCSPLDVSMYNATFIVNEAPDAHFCVEGDIAGYGDVFTYCYDEVVTVDLCEILSGEGPFTITYDLNGDEFTGTYAEGDVIYEDVLPVGTNTIELVSLVDNKGCTLLDPSLYTMTIEILPEPFITFAVNDNQVAPGYYEEFCYDETITVSLFDIWEGDAPFEVCYSVTKDGDPYLTNECVTLTNPGDVLNSGIFEAGTYELSLVSLTDANGCIATQGTLDLYTGTIVVNPEPDAHFCVEGDIAGYGDVFTFCYDEVVTVDLCEILSGEGPFTITYVLNGDEFTGTYAEGDVIYEDVLPVGENTIELISLVDNKGCVLSNPELYTMTININEEPDADFCVNSVPAGYGDVFTFCYDEVVTVDLCSVLSGTAPFEIEYTLNGDTFSGSYNEGDVIYDATLPAGQNVIELVSLTDANGCVLADPSLYTMTININPEPTLEVTLDGAAPAALNQLCQTESFEICLTGVDGTPDWTVEWEVSGPMGTMGDVMTGTSECWTYDAADFLPGIYDLTIVSLIDAEDCAASQTTLDSYAFQIEIVPAPTAYAGPDVTICEGDELPLTDATAENFSSVFWSHNGLGDFDDPTSVNPTYVPADGEVGNVTLFLVAQPLVPCQSIASDFAVLYIQPAPYAYAGEDATVCDGDNLPLTDATADDVMSALWTTTGDGTFSNPIAIHGNTYYPGTGDLGNTVTLCLTVQPVNPCETEAQDCLTLFVQPVATAFAGDDATILSDETYTLSQATATNNDGVLWETSGDGGFDDDQALNPTYTPGMQDIIDGEVLLTITAFGVGPCEDVVSNMLLTIQGVPPVVEITSPVDGTFFNYSPILVEGTASDPDGFVSFVEVRVNGGPWQLATGTENWSVEVQLDPCLNTIEARATDTQFLESDIDAVTDIKLNGQLIEMVPGWSYISSYIEATDPNFFTLEDYIVPQNNLVIMLNDNGEVFWPSEEINNLVEWNTQDGYKIKSDVNGTWLLAGENTANQTITLDAGPNIFPVLTNVDYPLPGDFNNEDILIIFELQTARIWWPDGELYTLTELKPGFGYLGNFYNSFDITYPDYVDCELKAGSSDVAYVTNVSPWELERTASVHFISITNEAVAELDNAEFIGAFDANGMCIGYADVREKADNYLLAVYGNESATSWKDGANVGEAINLVAYNGVEEAVVAKYDMSMPNFDGRYANSGLSKITSFKESSTGIGGVATSDQIKMFPNPATDVVSIYYPVNTQVEVTFTNASGSVVMTQEMSEQESQIDVSNLQPGVYFVKFESKGSTAVKRLVIK